MSTPDVLYRDEEGHWIIYKWNEHTSSPNDIQSFLSRWPPSRTPASRCAWIAAKRGQRGGQFEDVDGLRASFRALVKRPRQVTVTAVDNLARKHNVLGGKWLIYANPRDIDELWGKVVRLLCLERKRGEAKVSSNRGEDHVICVFMDDYTQVDEVNGLRDALREIGVTKKIGFKPDVYTYVGIYARNPWNIRPSLYFQ